MIYIEGAKTKNKAHHINISKTKIILSPIKGIKKISIKIKKNPVSNIDKGLHQKGLYCQYESELLLVFILTYQKNKVLKTGHNLQQILHLEIIGEKLNYCFSVGYH